MVISADGEMLGEGGLGPCCALIGHLPPLPASHWSIAAMMGLGTAAC